MDKYDYGVRLEIGNWLIAGASCTTARCVALTKPAGKNDRCHL